MQFDHYHSCLCKYKIWNGFHIKDVVLRAAALKVHGYGLWVLNNIRCHVKGMFYSESGGEMSNRHIKVPKIVSGPLFPVSDMNCSNKVMILTSFCLNKINLSKARMIIY